MISLRSRSLAVICSSILSVVLLLMISGGVKGSGGAVEQDISTSFDSFDGWAGASLGANDDSWNVSLDQSHPWSKPNALLISSGGASSGVIFIERSEGISMTAAVKVTLRFQVKIENTSGLVVYAGVDRPERVGDFRAVPTSGSADYQLIEEHFEFETPDERTIFVAIGINSSGEMSELSVDDMELTIEKGARESGRSLMDFIGKFAETLGFITMSWKNFLMIGISLVLFFLAIKKNFEPLLLIPIAFGIFIVNVPYFISGSTVNIMSPDGGALNIVYTLGVATELFPLLIFLGIGAMTDFGPLIANPKTALLGGAAQFGIFGALLVAVGFGYVPFVGDIIHYTMQEAASIAIIGSADGPTTIYTATQLAPHLVGPVAVAAYSYMALVPIIQPPVMMALTTKKERAVRMEQLRPVSKTEKLIFPFAAILLTALIIPAAIPLVGMLMFGNILKVCGVVDRLSDTAKNALMNTIIILLSICVGATMDANTFLQAKTLGIIALGLAAFTLGTAAGVLMGKFMYITSGGKVNPLIGAAGVSAVPMAARVVQRVVQKENPGNYLLMQAMGPNVSGVIGSAVAAGVLLALV
jgi:sodium ion-translocating decarboxylase beta subunit